MKILSQKRCIIGEAPIWCDFNKKLYHVNGYGNEICCIELETGMNIVRKLDFGVAAVGFTKNGEMLISCEDGAFILNDDGTRTPLYDRTRYDIKYGNDAKVGPDGRFYIGTQSSKRGGVGDAIDGKLTYVDGVAVAALTYICIASIAAYVLWNSLLKSSNMSMLSVIKFAEPLFACLFGALLLKENIFKWQYLVALILISVGIVISNKKAKEKIK